ncbi:uncharacterized protein LOC128332867 [Hemicordylus capensis]|uniref:uncharacterized protein LOC128332867 n=1 Tax=Hemicordylus capensis TaxID=884348 RepID=UPI0023030545|nr:uncharacterized protein LOC128332867 [Hemicordylus capensis]
MQSSCSFTAEDAPPPHLHAGLFFQRPVLPPSSLPLSRSSPSLPIIRPPHPRLAAELGTFCTPRGREGVARCPSLEYRDQPSCPCSPFPSSRSFSPAPSHASRRRWFWERGGRPSPAHQGGTRQARLAAESPPRIESSGRQPQRAAILGAAAAVLAGVVAAAGGRKRLHEAKPATQASGGRGGTVPSAMGRKAAERLRCVCAHPGWRVSWPAALLTASILNSILLPPATGLSVTPEPAKPKEGQSVTLKTQGLSDPFISCAWFRGETTELPKRIFIYYPAIPKQVHGDAYTGRETRVQPCSLQISDLMQNYSGTYTVVEENSVKPAEASVTIMVSGSSHSNPTGSMTGMALIGTLIYTFLH